MVWNGEINPGTLVSLMLYTLNLAMSFALLSNLYGEFMQVSHNMHEINAYSFSFDYNKKCSVNVLRGHPSCFKLILHL